MSFACSKTTFRVFGLRFHADWKIYENHLGLLAGCLSDSYLCESLKKKLSELTEEKKSQITGGTSGGFSFDIPDETKQYEIHVYPEEKKKIH